VEDGDPSDAHGSARAGYALESAQVGADEMVQAGNPATTVNRRACSKPAFLTCSSRAVRLEVEGGAAPDSLYR
jgi:hypothetical protein